MTRDEIADLVDRISSEVRSQMDPLMDQLFEDALIHGIAVLKAREDGVIERVDPIKLSEESDAA